MVNCARKPEPRPIDATDIVHPRPKPHELLYVFRRNGGVSNYEYETPPGFFPG